MTATEQTHDGTIEPRQVTVKSNGRTYERWQVDAKENGKRKRRFFKTEAAARRAIGNLSRQKARDAELQAKLAPKVGDLAKRFSYDELNDAHTARRILKDRATLEEAARFYLKHRPTDTRRTVKEIAAELIADKEQRCNDGEIERRSVTSARSRINGIVKEFGGRRLSDVATQDIDAWLKTIKHATTRGHYRRQWVEVVNFANGTAQRKTKRRDKTPHILTIEDAETLMRYCETHEPNMLPYFAICLFGGLRPESEVQMRLDWAQIDLDGDSPTIFVESSAKTGQSRFVKVTPNLRAWLLPHTKKSGPIHFSRHAWRRVIDRSGIEYEQDCLRHSCASYYCPIQGTAALQEQMGHDVRTFMSYYRQAVKERDTKLFWEIRPTGDAGVIPFTKSAAAI